jgi:hypothetical protein
MSGELKHIGGGQEAIDAWITELKSDNTAYQLMTGLDAAAVADEFEDVSNVFQGALKLRSLFEETSIDFAADAVTMNMGVTNHGSGKPFYDFRDAVAVPNEASAAGLPEFHSDKGVKHGGAVSSDKMTTFFSYGAYWSDDTTNFVFVSISAGTVPHTIGSRKVKDKQGEDPTLALEGKALTKPLVIPKAIFDPTIIDVAHASMPASVTVPSGRSYWEGYLPALTA